MPDLWLACLYYNCSSLLIADLQAMAGIRDALKLEEKIGLDAMGCPCSGNKTSWGIKPDFNQQLSRWTPDDPIYACNSAGRVVSL
jgi:hypothetical protein